jgi:hypothetical protein
MPSRKKQASRIARTSESLNWDHLLFSKVLAARGIEQVHLGVRTTLDLPHVSDLGAEITSAMPCLILRLKLIDLAIEFFEMVQQGLHDAKSHERLPIGRKLGNHKTAGRELQKTLRCRPLDPD